MILKIRSKYSLSCFVYISSAAASTSQAVTFPTPQAHPEFKFGTKQPYPIPFDECSPLAAHLSEATTVHGIFRHGYRFPSVKDMQKYKQGFDRIWGTQWMILKQTHMDEPSICLTLVEL